MELAEDMVGAKKDIAALRKTLEAKESHHKEVVAHFEQSMKETVTSLQAELGAASSRADEVRLKFSSAFFSSCIRLLVSQFIDVACLVDRGREPEATR